MDIQCKKREMEVEQNLTFSNFSVVLNESLIYDDSSSFYIYLDCEESNNFSDVIRNMRFVTVLKELKQFDNFVFFERFSTSRTSSRKQRNAW